MPCCVISFGCFGAMGKEFFMVPPDITVLFIIPRYFKSAHLPFVDSAVYLNDVMNAASLQNRNRHHGTIAARTLDRQRFVLWERKILPRNAPAFKVIRTRNVPIIPLRKIAYIYQRHFIQSLAQFLGVHTLH